MSMSAPRDVTALRAALQENLTVEPTPWPAPLWTRLSQISRRELGALADWLEQSRPAFYAAFADEDELLVALANAAERLGGDCPWELDQLLTEAEQDTL